MRTIIALILITLLSGCAMQQRVDSLEASLGELYEITLLISQNTGEAHAQIRELQERVTFAETAIRRLEDAQQ